MSDIDASVIPAAINNVFTMMSHRFNELDEGIKAKLLKSDRQQLNVETLVQVIISQS